MSPERTALPVLVLTGPTGSGKSAWAERLAEQAPVEIVSVDSAQVYRGLDIGTAKPSRAVRARIPHHLIDVCDPAEGYSAGRFVAEALECIGAIHGRGRVPLLVGGTMLYLRALIDGLAPLPQASPALRRSLDAQAAQEGWPALHAELERIDPQAAARIAPTDAQRIQRALEVCRLTGERFSELQRRGTRPLAGMPLWAWALVPRERAELHRHIAARFHAMLAAGWLEEVKALYARGDLSAGHASMRAVGYRQLWAHLAGECTLAEAIEQGIAATRQLAKRQLTWMRTERWAEWLDPAHQALSWNRDVRRRLAELQL
ncbi:MAG: tRNA (adenosine(37)-N6)-dimethylallyltransferase MiaA [Steroidobacteraceae bacterium]|jgi:tRNA dimethylallyltransferase